MLMRGYRGWLHAFPLAKQPTGHARPERQPKSTATQAATCGGKRTETGKKPTGVQIAPLALFLAAIKKPSTEGKTGEQIGEQSNRMNIFIYINQKDRVLIQLLFGPEENMPGGFFHANQ